MKNKYLIITVAFIIIILDLMASIYFFGSLNIFPNNQANLQKSLILISPSPTFYQNPESVSLNNNSQSRSGTNIQITQDVSISQSTADAWTKLLENVPTNPHQISATSMVNGKRVVIESGKAYPYANITFNWSGARANEPGTTIKGYYVYFGSNNTEIPFPEEGFEKSVNPKSQGKFIAANTYTFSNLEKGKIYYLYIQSYSTSKNPNLYYRFGMEQVGFMKTLSAKKLFVYKYE
jgi:hypothetical protein